MALRARITENPWDTAAWTQLAQEILSRGPNDHNVLSEQRAFLEELLTRFPTAVRCYP
jgi:hypothetical protein